jgi:hypothetical protein
MSTRVSTKHHPHDDAPDTAESFRRLVLLAPGPQHDSVRDQIVVAWLPIADRLGISQMHVSRLIALCCDRLRDQVMHDDA